MPRFRTERIAGIIRNEIRRASEKGFRVLHYSIQENHVHLIAEAETAEALSRGMQRLGSRIARSVNLLVSRHGTVWRERYHRRDLASPRQFRNALVYVMFNHRKHAKGRERTRHARLLDGLSSALWFSAWAADDALLEAIRRVRAGPPPVVDAKTWIASRGWHRLGFVRPEETPVSPG